VADVDVPGLTATEAARRLEQVGPNEVRKRGRISVRSSIGLQLRDPLIVVLLAACALTLVTGDLTDAAVIAFVVLVNTAVGVTQEVKADRAMTALEQLSAPVVRVRRGAVESLVPAADLVPGDVLLLGEGDIVPADCDLLETSSVLVDESALTGESIAVGKVAPRDQDAGDVLSSGTVIVKGRAVAVVTGTGASSALGRIAALLDTRVQATPLQRRLAELGRTLALVAVALCLLVLVLGLVRGEPLELMVVTAISLAVAAVPESLPAVVTFSLALGARRMVARNAVVRRLPAVETLGCVTVLATDKTGTLTEARMVVEALWTPEHLVEVSGRGLPPTVPSSATGHRSTWVVPPTWVTSCAPACCATTRTWRRPPSRDGSGRGWATPRSSPSSPPPPRQASPPPSSRRTTGAWARSPSTARPSG
jgi:Ca2+-transporting ATPase